MKYKIYSREIGVPYQILETAFNTILRVIYPFVIGVLTAHEPFWFVALVPWFFVNIQFKFERELEEEE